MRLDIRPFILSTWLTLFWGTFSSSLVFNYYARTQDRTPQTLRESLVLILGLWVGALMAGFFSALWAGQALRTLLWSTVLGYGLGAGIRLIYLKQFLPSGTQRFDTLFEILTLQSIPPYDAFVFWVLVGGSLVALLGALLSLNLPLPRLAHFDFPPRLWGGVWGLMTLTLLSLILLRSWETGYSKLTLLNTQWLLSPLLNMMLAAILGFVIGGFAFCPSRWSAVAVMFVGIATHLVLMWLLDGVLSSYDPLYGGVRPNTPNLVNFSLLWLGTPLMGLLAAFALHNLRDALRLSDLIGETQT